ncbi:helix-turn-helix domain-containing protein [uncultured Mycolicibacterium sp.]|uniref:PucR family transcriptional regulator n=1 Tax=uncultured Mycolicibacterium sp. TaxID=2320817 RepID=UPI0026115087|nr:helix-turn-helix domain-containing protein [uncultured Mycolicibacterium sp.]
MPSPAAREVIRRGAERVLNAPQDWLDELDRAVSAANPLLAESPEMAAASSRVNRAHLLHWASANVRAPGAPVPGYLGDEAAALTRDLVRRGLESYAFEGYRVGQNVSWRRWMEIVFELTDDPAVLREVLAVTSQSVSSFIDSTIARLSELIDTERAELTRGSNADRLRVATLLLEGAPIGRRRAEAQLGYRLDQHHTAAIVWSEQPDTAARALDEVVDAVGAAAGARPLNVLAGTATRWVWVAGRSGIDRAALSGAAAAHPEVRVAVGTTAAGVEGFRRSHLDALTTQRMLGRLHSPRQVASFDEVELVALVTVDPERADLFIRRTLGALAGAEPELREAVWMFIAAGHNASAAAERLYVHRNTLLRRLARAERLLPRPLADNGVHVAVALEILRWRGEN